MEQYFVEESFLDDDIFKNIQIDLYEMQMFRIQQENLILSELGVCQYDFIIQEGAFQKIVDACKEIFHKLIELIKRVVEAFKKKVTYYKNYYSLSRDNKFRMDVLNKVKHKNKDFKMVDVRCTTKAIEYAKNYKSAYGNKMVDTIFDAIDEIVDFYKSKKYKKFEDESLEEMDKMAYIARECPNYNELAKKCNYDISKFKSVMMDEMNIIEKGDEYITYHGECTIGEYIKYAPDNFKFTDNMRSITTFFDDLNQQLYLRQLDRAITKINELKNSEPEFTKMGNALYKLVECVQFHVVKNTESFNFCMQAVNKCINNFNKAHNYLYNKSTTE